MVITKCIAHSCPEEHITMHAMILILEIAL